MLFSSKIDGESYVRFVTQIFHTSAGTVPSFGDGAAAGGFCLLLGIICSSRAKKGIMNAVNPSFFSIFLLDHQHLHSH